MVEICFKEKSVEITSPGSLWKGYDVSALPFNESTLSEKTEGGAAIREFYFDGHTTADGRVRAYIRIAQNEAAKGVVLYLPDTTGDYNDKIVQTLFDYGYTVAVLDYLGTSETGRYTLYPKSLAHCNERGAKSFEVTGETQYSRWFIWTCLTRRAVKLLAKLYDDKKIFAVGDGIGGNIVYRLAAFDDGVTSCVTLSNIIPIVNGSGNLIINYRASLESSAYASICRVPLFMAVCSNAEDGSLDAMSELAGNTASLSKFRIIERALSGGICAVYPEIDKFFSTPPNNVIIPEIKASNSQNNLYFNITLKSKDGTPIDEERKFEVKLFVSFCIEEARFRNWMSIPALSLGERVYMANINVCNDNKHIHAFVNLIDENGYIQSSQLLTVLPKSIGITAKPGVEHRKIYDGSMGVDGWTSRDGGKVKSVNGPFDIAGVSSESNSLLIFKLGDPLFKVMSDSNLQVMVSGKPQNLTIKVADKTTTYAAQVYIPSSDNWHKFSLSLMNFKGPNGPLGNWSQIMMLEFVSEDQITVGSVLWV